MDTLNCRRDFVHEVRRRTHNGSALLALAFVVGIATVATAQPVSFQASNGQWMVAEGGGGGTVNANRNSPGAWETFTIEDFNGGDLYDGDQVAFRTDNGLYLQAQNGGGGAFLAVGGGPWAHETFTVVLLSGGDNRVDDGEVVALRSANGYYVVAEGGGGGIVNCDRTGIGAWEQWTIYFGAPPPPPPPSSLTFVINGFESDGAWALPGTDFSNAIAATYGAVPEFWFWSENSWQQVLPPYYSGIFDGAFRLANFLNGLPPGDVNLIAHSHGGNVVLASQYWSTRPIRRYINLATPINWDFGYLRYSYNASGRCQASSTADWVQFWGASPYQVGNFIYNVYQSIQGAYEAFDALIHGNYEDSLWYFAQSVFDAIQADEWLDTTRREVEGYTHFYVSLGHSELHTPGAWNGLPAFCR